MKLDSTLQELTLYNYQVEATTSVKDVMIYFKQNPHMPGVILKENNQLAGIISQTNFWQYMSLPYSLELSARRPIKFVFDFLKHECLIIPKDLTIIEAVKKALERPAKILEDPIVVEIAPQEYKLLDVHQILIAQAKIHEAANVLITNLYKDMDRANAKLKLLSSLDGLTNLANRRIFDEFIQKEWSRSLEARCISLILIDIDFFKKYNELYGHLAGDDCLRKIANITKKSVKRLEGVVARYRGDEIAIILPNKDAVDAANIAEKIRQKVTEKKIPNQSSSISNYITISLGIASTVPSNLNKPDMLLTAAKEALSQAKKSGRNRKFVWANSYRQTPMTAL